MNRRIVVGISVIAVAALLATNYTLNHFYVRGAYMQDSGWFAYLAAHTSQWPAPNPPAMGGTYFATHFSPGFYLLSAIYSALKALGLPILETAWFALTQGLWFAVIAGAAFSLLDAQRPSQEPKALALTAGLALMIAFNGNALAILSYPHFEIAIPALFLAFFALEQRGYRRAAFASLILGLLMREDAGLHYFGFFILLSIVGFWSPEGLKKRPKGWRFASLALFCLTSSIIILFLQKTLFASGDNAMARVYVGEPPFAHLSLEFVHERLRFFEIHRLYLLAPLVLLLILALFRRSLPLLIGVIAVIPWLMLSLAAVAALPGNLTSHYAFPLMISFFWPLIASSLFKGRDETQASSWAQSPGVLDVSLICLSSIAFYAFDSQGNADASPWKHFGLEWVSPMQENHSILVSFLNANRDIHFIVDDAVASLRSDQVTASQWRNLLAFSDQELQDVDAILFQSNAWLSGTIRELALKKGFYHLCRLGHSKFIALSRQPVLKACAQQKLTRGQPFSMALEDFDFLPGWGGVETSGRWTLGDRVILPDIPPERPALLCLRGHGYLPNPESRITLRVVSLGKVLGEIDFDAQHARGILCVDLPAKDPKALSDVGAELQIQGAVSPLSLGLSEDSRPLGVMVEAIDIKSP